MGRTIHKPRRPSGLKEVLGVEGRRGALLLALDAGHTTLGDEVTEGSAHLLSRAAKLRSHLLVGDGLGLTSEGLVNALAEGHNLLVHLGLARTRSVLLDLRNLLLAEGNDLRIVSHGDGDAGVEVLLGGLGLGHGISPFLARRVARLSLWAVPFERLFVYWGGRPLFLLILYHIF